MSIHRLLNCVQAAIDLLVLHYWNTRFTFSDTLGNSSHTIFSHQFDISTTSTGSRHSLSLFRWPDSKQQEPQVIVNLLMCEWKKRRRPLSQSSSLRFPPTTIFIAKIFLKTFPVALSPSPSLCKTRSGFECRAGMPGWKIWLPLKAIWNFCFFFLILRFKNIDELAVTETLIKITQEISVMPLQ